MTCCVNNRMTQKTSVEAHDAWRSANRDRWRSHITDLLDGVPEVLGHYRMVDHVKTPE